MTARDRIAAARHWLAIAEAPPARLARRAVRGAHRLRARVRSGSVAAEMDRIVADALDPATGSALDARVAGELTARRRRAQRHGDRR